MSTSSFAHHPGFRPRRIVALDKKGNCTRLLIPAHPLSATDWSPKEGPTLPELLIGLLFGPEKPEDWRHLERVELEWTGGGSWLAVFEVDSQVVNVHRDGVAMEFGGRHPGEHLFDLDRQAFRKRLLVDGRNLISRPGAPELRRLLLSEILGLDTQAINTPNDQIPEIRRRRAAVEAELSALHDDRIQDELEITPPQALEELNTLLSHLRRDQTEDAARRAGLAEAGAKVLAITRSAPAEDLVRRCEEISVKLAALFDRRFSIERRLKSGTLSTPLRFSLSFLILVAAGLYFAGEFLGERQLLNWSFGLSAATLILGAGAWILAGWRQVHDTKVLRGVQDEERTLRHAALPVLLRLGQPVSEEELTPETLRELLTKASQNASAAQVEEILRPFVDYAENKTRGLAGSHGSDGILSREQNTIAEYDGSDVLNHLELLVSRLGESWRQAIREHKQQIEERLNFESQREADRQVLIELQNQLTKAEERAVRVATEISTRSEILREFAEDLNRRLVPLLRRALGEKAPVRFTKSLDAEFAAEPNASTNGFILLCARLLLNTPDRDAGRVVLFVSDLDLAIGAELEQRFTEVLSDAALHYDLVLLERSKRRLLETRRRLRELAPARSTTRKVLHKSAEARNT